jgi:hypothetical protein
MVKNVRQVVLNMWTGSGKLGHDADYSISRMGQFANEIRTEPSELRHYLEGRIKKKPPNLLRIRDFERGYYENNTTTAA